MESSIPPQTPMRLKIEINTREHGAIAGHEFQAFSVNNPWFSGTATVTSFTLAELIGTKLRALYQRRKGRDLFDLHQALTRASALDPRSVVQIFQQYMARGGYEVTRAEFEASMTGKLDDRDFRGDIIPLLRRSGGSGAVASYDVASAYDVVRRTLITILPGAPWSGGSAPE
jgi:hypothetical protein